MCINVHDMKFLISNLCSGGLFTDDNDNNNTTNDNNKRWTIHDYIGYLEFMINEPKIPPHELKIRVQSEN